MLAVRPNSLSDCFVSPCFRNSRLPTTRARSLLSPNFTTDVKFGLSSDRARVVGNLEFRKQGETKQSDSEFGRTASINEGVIYSSPANIILPSGENVILNYNVFKPGSY